MKRILLSLLTFITVSVYAQQKGISYQAVILNPKSLSAPGADVANTPLANKNICMLFEVVDGASQIEYQESVQTLTDQFGMVNLMIGNGTRTGGYAAGFDKVGWAEGNKRLVVSLNTTGSCANYTKISDQPFMFVPYALFAQNSSVSDGNITTAKLADGAITDVKIGTGISKSKVGLENVDNTSDANKPVSVAAQSALDTKENSSNKSTSTSLGNSDVLFPTQNAVKSYVDGAVVGGSTALKLNIADTTAMLNSYARVASTNIAIALKANSASPTFTGTVSGITPTMVGLANVNNTSDANKPVSIATQTSLALKENAANKSTATALGNSDVLFPTQNAVKTYIDGADVRGSSALVSEITRATGAEVVNATAITTEAGLRSSADAANTSVIVTEGTTRRVADSTLTANLALETSRATTAEGINTSAIVTEGTTRRVADSTLTANLALETSRATTAEGVNASAIVTEATERTSVDALKANIASPTFTGTVGGINKTMVGLGNVDNTSDATKNAAIAILTNKTLGDNLNLNSNKVTNLATPTAGSDAATKAYVDGAITSGTTGIVSGASGGTGVDNTNKTITLGGNLTTSGAFATTLTSTAVTNVTLPTSGTLATTANVASAADAKVADALTDAVTTIAPSQNVVFDALALKVAGNTAITGATKTKVTYDAKGLVTAGADATTADIAASTDKKYVTDAQLVVVGNTTGANTGDETAATIKTKLGVTTLTGSNTGDQTLSSLGAVAGNTAITGATKTKVTYDTKGLVTAGADATTADIAASTDKKYVTDAQLVVVGNTTGANTGDETAATIKTKLGVSTLSGANTGDQDLSSFATTAALSDKVDKVTGKGLSTNDYTTTEQTKLSAISGSNTGDETAATIKTKLGVTTLSGANTGDQTTVTGNAGTATKFATSRSINGVAFDGTADITVTADATTLTGASLKSTILGSSLTSVGTLANLTVTNPIAGSITGNAATVTTNANLTGEVTSTGNATTVTNAAVIAKLITGYTSGAGTIAATDNILQAVQKLDGNNGLKANSASPTFTGIVTAPVYASTPLALTAGATITWDPTIGLNASVVLSTNSTLAFNTTPTSGTYGTLVVTQPASGGPYTLTLPSVTNKILGSTSTTTIGLSNTANAIDVVSFYYDGTSYYWNVGQGYGVAATVATTNLASGVTGTLPVANGGTGVTTSTGSGSVVLATSPTLTAPALGTPASGIATNLTGLPLTTGVTGSLSVANGGTGAITLTANNLLLGNGTNALQTVAPGTAGNVLTSNGTTWTSVAAAGGGNTHTIGESYGGGIVFYVYDGGQHGLIAATTDQSAGIAWINLVNRSTGTTGDGLGAGAMNTAMIVATQMADSQSGNFAAKVCADYSVTVGDITYGDWYLPSTYELNLLELKKYVVGGFVHGAYWSSSEITNSTASYQNYLGGTMGSPNKNNGYRVRAIRAF